MPLPMFSSARRTQNGIRYTLAIAAGKGGVGKSTITVNLARCLHQKGFRVGILDADLYGPSIRHMLPEQTVPIQNEDHFIPALCEGIKVMSMAYFRPQGQASIIRAPIANSVILQFVDKVDWGDLDFLLIDFPPGTGDIQLTLSQKGHLFGGIFVTMPQEIAQIDVRKAISMFVQLDIPIIGIVENMSYFLDADGSKRRLFGKGGGCALSLEYKTPFLGEIAIDPNICCSGDSGKNMFSSMPDSIAVKSFEVITHNLLEQLQKKAYDPHIGDFKLEWKEMPESTCR